MSSGGFSPMNQSIGAYASPAIQLIITFFMFLAGVNFVLHYAALRGDFKKMFRNPEWRFFCMTLIIATAFIFMNLTVAMGRPILEAFRLSAFQVVSIATSTGFTTDNFVTWPYFSEGILFLLMAVGGCAGSTSGGFKQMRLYLLLLMAKNTLVKQVYPKAVSAVKIGKRAISEDVLTGVSNLLLIYLVIAMTRGRGGILTLFGLGVLPLFLLMRGCSGPSAFAFDGGYAESPLYPGAFASLYMIPILFLVAIDFAPQIFCRPSST